MSFIVIGDDIYIPYQPSSKLTMYKRYRLDSIVSQEEMSLKLFGSPKLSRNNYSDIAFISEEATEATDTVPQKRKRTSIRKGGYSILSNAPSNNKKTNMSTSNSFSSISPSSNVDLLQQQQQQQQQPQQPQPQQPFQQKQPLFVSRPILQQPSSTFIESPNNHQANVKPPETMNKYRPIAPADNRIPVNISEPPQINERALDSLPTTSKIIDPVVGSEDVLAIVKSGNQIRLNFRNIDNNLHFLRFINGIEYYFECNSATQLLEYAIKDLDIILKNSVTCTVCKTNYSIYDTFKINNEYICCKCSSESNSFLGCLKDPFDMKKERGGLMSAGVYAYCCCGSAHFKPLSHFLLLDKGKYKFHIMCKYCRLKNVYLYYRMLNEKKIAGAS